MPRLLLGLKPRRIRTTMSEGCARGPLPCGRGFEAETVMHREPGRGRARCEEARRSGWLEESAVEMLARSYG